MTTQNVMFYRVEYNPSLYLDYARENGTKYGYYKEGDKI